MSADETTEQLKAIIERQSSKIDTLLEQLDAALARVKQLEAEKQTVLDMAMTESKRMESALDTERSVNRHIQARLAAMTSDDER